MEGIEREHTLPSATKVVESYDHHHDGRQKKNLPDKMILITMKKVLSHFLFGYQN